jgi:hypothetical protein
MAALIGKIDSDDGRSQAQRLARRRVDVQAATWHTFVDATVLADGSGSLEVRQGGQVVHRFVWGPEASGCPERTTRKAA